MRAPRVWIVIALVGLGLSGCASRDAPAVPVLLLTLDTTRADRLGAYGSAAGLTPNLDRLAQDGTVFERAYAQAAVTPVSHASILTGREPYHHGLRVLHGHAANRLDEQETTLAEMLADEGYATAAFVSAFPVSERFGFEQGYDRFDASFGASPDTELMDEYGIVDTGRSQRHAGKTTDLALDWLARSGDGTFHLGVNYFDPHDVDVVPPPEAFTMPDLPDLRERLRAAYDLEVRYMDAQIGRLLDALRTAGRYDETLIVVVADHGEGLGDHDWWTHGVLYDEQIRVPLIVKPPDAHTARRHAGTVRALDLVPTVLEVVGLPVPGGVQIDGRSLAPALRGEPMPGAPIAYADSVNMLNYRFAEGIADRKDDMYFAIVDWPWKSMHHRLHPTESELYHLEQDPAEVENRFWSNARRAGALLDELEARPFTPAADLFEETMSERDLERLRSLGYVK